MTTPETPYLISIFHNRDLYEFRCRGTKITSITLYKADTNFIESLSWTDLSDELQSKAITEVRRHLNYD